MPGIYIHIPFCEKKCLYCDFYSIESMSSMENFLRCLDLEIDRYATFSTGDVEFEAIFFGGGTPSLLSPQAIGSILNRLHKNFRISATAEVTLETNPGTVDLEKLREFLHSGINRLSVGIQSFHDEELKFLSRIHSAKEAKDCIRLAKKAGFDNISLDLIFALPNQGLRAWEENLSTAVSLAPQHISAYSLIVEEGTPLARMVKRGEVLPAAEETESEMYCFTMEYLGSNGYEHYEVSNYAKLGYRCKHNSVYWNHDSYLGFGPSAHSFWWKSPLSKPTRWWNVASVGRYCEMLLRGESAAEGEERLESSDLLMEEIFLGLRSGGIDIHKLQCEYGINLFERYPQKLDRFVQENLLTIDRETVRLTPKGFLLCDGIALELSA
jgi:oxygen-independent coproporphyrinogen-3 oxidase